MAINYPFFISDFSILVVEHTKMKLLILIKAVELLEIACVIDKTLNNVPCQNWREQTPHVHEFQNMPDDNYCRYEGGSTKPWCYTTDENVRVGYCSTCGEFDPWVRDSQQVGSINDDEEEPTTTVATGTGTTTTQFSTTQLVTTTTATTTTTTTESPRTRMVAEFDEVDEDGLTMVCVNGIEVYIPDDCVEVHPIVTIVNTANGGVNEALEGDVTHDIVGNVTLLIDNYSGSIYDVDSMTGTVARFDHRRMAIHDVGTGNSQINFGGYLATPDETIKFHLCPNHVSFEQRCYVEPPACLSQCWVSSGEDGACEPLEESMKVIHCHYTSITVEFDPCLFPEDFNKFTVGDMTTR